MKKFIFILLFLFSCAVYAAAPVIPAFADMASRTSGTAPLCVTFNATGVTDAGTSTPFHSLLYFWSFGDAGAGTWSTGANTSASKNAATGAVAAHCYETAGTYTVTLQVTDGSNTTQTTGTITVTAADTTFATTATVCFFNDTVGTGCPTGATETPSSGFDAALAACIGTTKRCLFKRGDTFVSSTTGTVASAGPNTIGAYGSGALPIITATNIAGVINVNNAAVNDLRIMDLDIRGNGATDTGTCISFGANVSNVSVIGVSCSEIGKGIASQGTNVLTGSVFQGNTISNYYSASGGNAFFIRLATSAIIGNTLGPTGSTGEHVLRMQRGQRVAINNNTAYSSTATKTNITLRGDVHSTTAEDSFYVYVSGNKVTQGSVESLAIAVTPSADSEDARLYDFVLERNMVTLGAVGTRAFSINAVNITVRNNLINLSASGAASTVGVIIDQGAGAVAPLPDNVRAYNNTIYSTGATVTRGVWASNSNGAVTNSVLVNNLCYFTAGTGATTCMLDQGTGTTASNNTPNAPGTCDYLDSPSFDNVATAPQGFRIGTGSCAANLGTAVFPASNNDFFNCDDTTANERIGAFVPRVRATCRGAAQ